MLKTLSVISLVCVLALTGCRSWQDATNDPNSIAYLVSVNKTKVAQITARVPTPAVPYEKDFAVVVSPDITDVAIRDALTKYVSNALTYKGMTPAANPAKAGLTVKVSLDVQSHRRTKFIVTQEAYNRSNTLCWSLMSSCTTSLYEQPLGYLPGLISAGLPFIGVHKTGPINVYNNPDHLRAVLR
ncbi:MAG: hypothetical protein GX937_10380 [Lentisphaerae bacterium]|jgi:hypothetical protein|nr:hypothetical protein [Lentisphaerota bacterium]